MRLAIVVSHFNEKVTKKLFASAMQRLAECDMTVQEQDISWVPGAVEVPLVAQQYAATGVIDAVICLGAVIRGETSHYDFVCHQVSQGCQQVVLAHNIPVIFGVLTTETVEQAFARAGGAHSDKGREAVDTAITMVTLMNRLRDTHNQSERSKSTC